MQTKVVTADVETTGLNPFKDKVLTVAFSVNGGPVEVQDVSSTPVRPPWAADEPIIFRGHNVKFDALFLSRLAPFKVESFDDTRVLAYLNYPEESHGLKPLAKSKLGVDTVSMSDFGIKVKKKHRPYFEKSDKYFEIDGLFYLKKKLYWYNGQDVDLCNRLRRHMVQNNWYRNVEQPLTKLLYLTELRGAQLDVPHLKVLDADLSTRIEDALDLIRLIVGDAEFNPSSSKQVNAAFTERGYDLSKYTISTKTGYKCDKLFLKRMAWRGDELAAKMLVHRKLNKLRTTYTARFLNDIDENGRLHGAFNQAGKEGSDAFGTSTGSDGTATGRLTSSDPNLQQIPARTTEGKQIRRAFVPSTGYVMFDADLKQIEPRLVGHYSQSPKLIRAYKEKLDTHALFGADIFNRKIEDYSEANLALHPERKVERFIGKTSWLATTYGCSYKKLLLICELFSDDPLTLDLTKFLPLWDRLSDRGKKELIRTNPSEEEARILYAKWMFFKNVQESFWAKNPEIEAWRNEQIERTRRTGFVTTYGGRIIKIDGLDAYDKMERLKAERKVINYQIQPSAADIMKLILLRYGNEVVYKDLGHMLAVVHDEILGEFREELDRERMMALIYDIMCNSVQLNNIPLDTDAHIMSSWAEK